MKKSVVILTLALVLALVALPVAAAGFSFKMLQAEAETAYANLQIQWLVFKAQNDGNPNTDLEELVAKTDAIAKDFIEDKAKEGVIVECVLTPYVIDGKTVYIDPLHVIVVPGGTK